LLGSSLAFVLKPEYGVVGGSREVLVGAGGATTCRAFYFMATRQGGRTSKQ
jgi:hypothetical protein